MIDEEDDEEILNKKISFKSVLKNIIIISLILLGALLIYSGNTPDTTSNIFLGFMLICVGSTLMQVQKHPPEPIRQTLTILTCVLCGIIKVRHYKQGDFVFMETRDKCNKCNDKLRIKQIYSVKLKKPTEENKPKEKEPFKEDPLRNI